MARFRLTNPLVTADSSVQQNFEGIQGYLNKLAPTVPVVTSLPTSPADGTVIDYVADSSNGVVWRFRYRAGSGSSYKWEFVGGGALYAENATSGTANSGSPVAFSNNAQVTVPLAGDYEVEYSGDWSTANSGLQGQVRAGVGTGSGTITIRQAWSANNNNEPFAGRGLLTGVSASAVVQLYGWTTGGTAVLTANSKAVTVRPRRVG